MSLVKTGYLRTYVPMHHLCRTLDSFLIEPKEVVFSVYHPGDILQVSEFGNYNCPKSIGTICNHQHGTTANLGIGSV